jgi:hypothetical protein
MENSHHRFPWFAYTIWLYAPVSSRENYGVDEINSKKRGSINRAPFLINFKNI